MNHEETIVYAAREGLESVCQRKLGALSRKAGDLAELPLAALSAEHFEELWSVLFEARALWAAAQDIKVEPK